MEKELRIINVNKKYKLTNKEYFQALYNINVEFDKGELVSIVGESGSGKSTLMNLIGGLDSDFTGQIIAGGENLNKLTDKQLDQYRKNKVGFVFQSFNLISHLSILDNVTLALTLSNMNEKEKIAKATKMLKLVGLDGHLKKKPTQLSGGQKQRVAIARALINDPEIIIADEPTGALDSETSMQILNILKEIADSGKLVIMVTHSERVASISSRVVKISDGRIVEDTTNPNYQKTEPKAELETKPTPAKTQTNGKKKVGKEKQNLSLVSAIRLSFHNMWASKVKNILMAVGVAIGIGSLILMMSFSSGITDFINNTMKSYSDPTIATISKKSEEGSSPTAMFDYNPFTDEERTQLYADINAHLQSKGIDFQVSADNVDEGFNMMTMMSDAKVYYSPSGRYDREEDEEGYDIEASNIVYIYTIPPYYTDQNVIDGEMSTAPELNQHGNKVGGGGFMFTPKIYELLGEDPLGKTVEIAFNFAPASDPSKVSRPLPFRDEVCGIMDTSIMSSFLVVYVDYDYLHYLFEERGIGDQFAPTHLYIKTPSEEITNEINAYLATTSKYTGSVEEQLAGMFTNLSSVIGTSLIVISCISLFVSAMMILVVLYMSVSERTKEIGVLKSIGARRKDIKRIFTSESLLIGLLSGIIGIIFNLVLTGIVCLVLSNTIGLAPISYRWWYFAVAIAVSVVISMLSGLYPASKAAKLDPVESLRRE